MKHKKQTTDLLKLIERSSGWTSKDNSVFSLWALIIFITGIFALFPYEKGIEVETYPRAGEVAKTTIIAPFKFSIHKQESELLKEHKNAESRVIPIFRLDTASTSRSLEKIDSLSQLLIEYRELSRTVADTADSTAEDFSDYITKHSDIESYLSRANILAIAQEDSNPDLLLNELRRIVKSGIISVEVLSTINELERRGREFRNRSDFIINSNNFIEIIGVDGNNVHKSLDSVTARSDIYNKLIKLNPPSSLNSNIVSLISYTTSPNLLYDHNETSNRRALELQKINTLKRVIVKDQEIVRQHQVVTPEIEWELETLRQLESEIGTRGRTRQIIVNTALIMLILITGAVTFLYLSRVIPPSTPRDMFMLAVSILTVGQILIIRLTLIYFPSLMMEYSTGLSWSTIIFSGIPTSIAIIMVAILFNTESGFLLTVFLSVYLGVISNFNLTTTIEVFITGSAASYIGASVRYRKDFISLLIWLIVVNSIVVFFCVLAAQEVTIGRVGYILIYALANSLISVLCVSLLLPLFESRFNFTTDMTLIELADMSHPLLKRLSIEATGTYNHSIQVANLAEAAADEIGANSLLCRVASYYHDIGKIAKKPIYFIENQNNRKNPHDSMPAQRSVKIIMDHVKDGVKLGEEYGLPKAILSAVEQHHGDALMVYFWDKAQNSPDCDSEQLNKHDFSYEGPKPQTAEMAIIMIADSLEAASRTFKGASVKELRDLIKKITYQKIKSGQLDECGLTFDEVNRMLNGFLRVLQGVFHSRIQYNDEDEEVSDDEKNRLTKTDIEKREKNI